jgi:hypothetical protein
MKKTNAVENKRWTAAELRKLPPAERDAIMEAAAALAEEEYRNNPELTAFEAFSTRAFVERGVSKMTQIILDAGVSTQLHNLAQTVELCDPSGQVLGRFVPLIDLSEWEPLSPDVSEEELDRRAQSKEKRYTTAEVLACLEKL